MSKKWWYGIVGLILAFLILLLVQHHAASETQVSSPQDIPTPIVLAPSKIGPNTLPGIQKGDIPWDTDTKTLKARLGAIGLPALAAEGTVLHIHQHLDLYIHGRQVEIPANIGINYDAGFISEIHTHDTTGIIHVESPIDQTFYLGQFFDIWGVRFTQTCIGGYCADDTNSLKVYTNGKKYTGKYQDLSLISHQEIVITYGTDAEIPASIPSTFDFPDGY